MADDSDAHHTGEPERGPAAARRAVPDRRTAPDTGLHSCSGVRRDGGYAAGRYGEGRRPVAAPRAAVPLRLPAPHTLPDRRGAARLRTRASAAQGRLHGAVPHRGLRGIPEPTATALRAEDGTHPLDGPQHAEARPYRDAARRRHRTADTRTGGTEQTGKGNL